ncbi:MAG: hypothetical protein Q4D55_04005 [Eubacteriales bacterium]|nr:hypothetical protein [Eubacteriales bacterium]
MAYLGAEVRKERRFGGCMAALFAGTAEEKGAAAIDKEVLPTYNDRRNLDMEGVGGRK